MQKQKQLLLISFFFIFSYMNAQVIDLVDPSKSESPTTPVNTLKILSYKEKNDWILETKYNVGNSE